MHDYITIAAGIAGGFFAALLGGWDAGLQTLLIFMTIDTISGVALAGFFKNSKKCRSGALSSKCSWRGLCKKGMQLLIVLIGYRLDIMLGADFVRTAVIIAFIANELLNIIENASLMGIPVPSALSKALDLLQEKGQ